MLKFPSSFPVKVMGRNTPDFELLVFDLVRQHAPELTDDALHRRPSRDGNYLSVTVTVLAQSREQLDAIYQTLSAHDQVLMVL